MKRSLLCLAALGLALSSVQPVSAATIQFNLSTPVCNNVPGCDHAIDLPASASTLPVAVLTFTDVAGGVEFTLASSLEVATEYFLDVAFNSVFTRPQDLMFGAPTKTGSFTNPALTQGGDNALSTAPPNGFDFRLRFTGTDAATRFNALDSITYLISCSVASCAGLDATDFNALNSPPQADPSHNGFYAAASLGYGTDSDGLNYGDKTNDNLVTSGTAAVPEPASMALLGTGLLGLAARRLRRK